MPEPMTSPKVERDPGALLADWLTVLDHLIESVKSWAEGSGWKTRVIGKSMKDSILGTYRAPALLMQRETVEVILNPVSRFVPGAEGAVDLYLMPAYDDIASLYLMDGEWTLHYIFRDSPAISGVREPEVMTLSEGTFSRVLREIASHAS
jgi:hypothetical protein